MEFFDEAVWDAVVHARCGRVPEDESDIRGISYMNITGAQSLEDLTQLPSLRELWLHEMRIDEDEIELLARLPALRTLVLCNSTIAPGACLGCIQRLEELRLLQTPPSGFEGDGMRSLRLLYIEDVNAPDLGLLERLEGLQDLTICECGLEDLSALGALAQLRRLDLSNNRISDVTPLGALTQLRELNLMENRITDISELAPLTQMRKLNLSGNVIADGAPLMGMKKLRWLEMRFGALADKRILAQKPFSRLENVQIDIPETEPEAVRAERLRKKYPRVKKLSDVHPRVHFCRDAMLVSVTDGMGRIALRRYGTETGTESCELYFDDRLMVEGDVTSSTYRGILRAGYDGFVMDDAACSAARDGINADFESLDVSLPSLAPLLGLFASGTYLIADFDMFPYRRDGRDSGDYFWDAPEYGCEAPFAYSWYSFVYYDVPRYLMPTEPASRMNPAQVDAYIDRLKENNHALRSVAFYLNGGVAMLLDGHHKAAAAAALGIPARTLVIFYVQDDAQVLEAVRGSGRMLLTQVSRYLGESSPLRLCSADGRLLGEVCSLERMKRKRLYLPMGAERAYYSKWEEEPHWGRVPDEYRQNLNRYPLGDYIASGTQIPPDQIRKIYSYVYEGAPLILEERETGGSHAVVSIGGSGDMRGQLRGALQQYLRLFPQSKWLSDAEKERIMKKDERFD